MKTEKSLTDRRYLYRNSGIELLKIIAIILIAINHTTQSIQIGNLFPFLKLQVISADVNALFLNMFRTFGMIGNLLFFACSSWFLLDSKKSNKQKVFSMIFDIWTVSFIFLLAFIAFDRKDVTSVDVFKSLLPTTNSNNWYLTFYILFYLAHPYINYAIYKMSKAQLLRITLVTVALYHVLHFVIAGWFFGGNVLYMTTLYFVMAYIKLYMNSFSENKRLNLILLLLSLSAQFLGMSLHNFLGLKYQFFNHLFAHWIKNYSPFVIVIAITSFNLFRQLKFTNKFINYLSSLSLLIYIIHENILFRQYCRPLLLKRFADVCGTEYIVPEVVIFAFALFIASAILACFYKELPGKLVKRISAATFSLIRKLYLQAEKKLLTLK